MERRWMAAFTVACVMLAGCSLLARFDEDDLDVRDVTTDDAGEEMDAAGDSDAAGDPDASEDPGSEPVPCTEGPCCNSSAGLTWGPEFICDTGTEFRCDGDGCGANGQMRTMVQFCSGSSTDCDGRVVGEWTSVPGSDCGADEICETDGTLYASCTTCVNGCHEPGGVGTCFPDCHPDDGPCCDDDGTLLGELQICATSTEYRCEETTCGADAQERTVYQHCDGESPDCNGVLSRDAEWSTSADCTVDQICDSDGTTYSSCVTCDGGCLAGVCTSAQCNAGACCNVVTGTYRPSSFRCDATPVDSRYQCAGTGCGDDVQVQHQYRYCSGASAACGDGNLQWSGWETHANCALASLCDGATTPPTCSACEHGCAFGSCFPDCSPAATCCTLTGTFKDSSATCDSWTEYDCSGAGCGDDVLERTAVQHCSGASAACDGDVTGDWSVPPGGDCTIDQICMLGGSGGEVYGTTGSCHTCEYGCDNTTEDGGCLSACDPADPCCGSDGNVLPSSEVCLTWTELECSGSGCGDDVQQGSMVQHCSGVGSLCDGMITSTWTVLTDCSDDQLCADDGTTPGCETCPFGCAELGGVGACYPECRPAEPCCTDGGMFRPDTFVCDSWSVQTCVPDQSCGSDVYGIEVVQSCSGDGPDCDGAIDEGTTTLLVPCGPNDMCSCSTSGATGDLTCTCSPDSAC